MSEQKTHAEIIEEMRALSNSTSDGIIAINGRSIADRLEAALKREKATAKKSLVVGNAAKMRKALVEIDELTNLLDIPENKKNLLLSPSHSLIAVKMRRIIKRALEEPPRNCDVGTPNEQEVRHMKFCRNYPKCTGCPCAGRMQYNKCEFAWGQMSYEGGENDGSK